MGLGGTRSVIATRLPGPLLVPRPLWSALWCRSADRKVWLGLGSVEEEGNSSSWFIYLFMLFYLLYLFPGSDFSDLREAIKAHSRSPWAARDFGLWVHVRQETCLFRSQLLHPPLCLSPALAAHGPPSQTGSQGRQEWAQTSKVFEEELTLKTRPWVRAAVRAAFRRCLWNLVPQGLSQGLRSFSLPPPPSEPQ